MMSMPVYDRMWKNVKLYGARNIGHVFYRSLPIIIMISFSFKS